jgi:hypothetical protein
MVMNDNRLARWRTIGGTSRRPLSQVRSVSRGTDKKAARSRCLNPAARRSSRISLIATARCHPAGAVVHRPPAYVAGDRSIYVSYCDMAVSRDRAETFGKSNARVLAQTRKTGHFFRFVFAEEFLGYQNLRIL